MNTNSIFKDIKVKLSVIALSVALTIGIHYGWILEPIFGHSNWIHAIHGRFCYIPIVIAAAWFGLRGGLTTAAVISLLVLPYIVLRMGHASDLSGELVELIFYFAIATLAGALVDREWLVRRKQEQTQLQLERAHKLTMIGQMAAGVAHEIKNPLASIKGALEIMGDSKTSGEERREFHRIALKEIQRTDRTISEYLQFARPRQPELGRLDLSTTLAESLRQIEAQAAGKRVGIKSEIEPGLYVLGDGEKLHQVFLNLLLNAVDASGEDSEVSVSLDRVKPDRLEVVIADRGVGISTEDAGRIFEPFFTTKSSGTGLGLAVVKSIIESHNGQITVSSRPGHGTRVRVHLPAYEDGQ